MDSIRIDGLLARCIIGITEDERREKQDVVIDVILSVDTRRAGRSDRFEHAVDYRAIKKRILSMVEASSYQLVEALAERIADICLQDDGVSVVEVTVEKPGALRLARSVGVTITRQRGG